MIIGAHVIINSKHPKRDRAFFHEVLKFPSVDTGDGWLIFGLPPSEVALHPATKNNIHEFYLLCDDVKNFVAQMKKQKVKCGKVQKQSWGLLTNLKLPGGGDLGIYQPLHARPKSVSTKGAIRKVSSKRRTGKASKPR